MCYFAIHLCTIPAGPGPSPFLCLMASSSMALSWAVESLALEWSRRRARTNTGSRSEEDCAGLLVGIAAVVGPPLPPPPAEEEEEPEPAGGAGAVGITREEDIFLEDMILLLPADLEFIGKL